MTTPTQHRPGWTWGDGERTIILREGGLEAVAALLAAAGFANYALLSTERALAAAPAALIDAAAEVFPLPPGQVPVLAAGLIDRVGDRDLVGFGGGRVIDTAKAIAAIGGNGVFAVASTLSGAEMTAFHRLPLGYEAITRVRPRHVLIDPELVTSAPEEMLRAGAVNALAHAAEALYTPITNPVAEMAALRGVKLVAAALSRPREERAAAGANYDLALGATLCAYALDSAGYALIHVLCQSTVRVSGAAHAAVYASLLAPSLEWLGGRAAEQIERFAEALGTDLDGLRPRLDEIAGKRYLLREIGVRPSHLAAIVALARARPELASTPNGAPSDADLQAVLAAAW